MTSGSSNPPASPQGIERTMRILWGAMVFSQLLLFGVLFANPSLHSGAAQTPTAVDLPLTVVAIVALFGSSAYRRYARSDGQLRALGQRALQGPTESRAARVYAALMGPMIVSLALHEGIALVGFVAAFLYKDALRMLPFLAVALMLDAFVFPQPRRVLERVKQLVPQLGSLAVLIALCSSLACSFTGGDYTPMKEEPQTPCLHEAQGICKEKLGSADFPTCVAREKYRCEVVEDEQQKQDPNQPKP